MVITPICIVWVVVFTHETQPAVPAVPPMDIGPVCRRIDAEHPLAKRSARAALLGGCQTPPERKPRIAALLRPPAATPRETGGVDEAAGIPAPCLKRTMSSDNGDEPSKAGAGASCSV